MPNPVRALTCSIALVSGLAGCAGAAVTPKNPAPAPAPAQAKATPTDETAKSAEAQHEKADTGASTSSDADPRADGLRKASRPPADLITGPNLVYVFNFKESEIGAAARERCAGQGDDPGAVGACLEKARSKVPVELIRFIKEPSGQLWWVTYNRYKGNLLKWHRVEFKAGPETDDRITLNLIGEDKGIAPMARVPRHLEIELPNDYSIVVTDPELGKMAYDAKIGTMEVD